MPALDAVLFLQPRRSIVDVVQAVGRVMRLAPGKDYGYVILPVAVPAGVSPEEALRDNKAYQVVWQVLQGAALPRRAPRGRDQQDRHQRHLEDGAGDRRRPCGRR